jgi:hypothetical protein
MPPAKTILQNENPITIESADNLGMSSKQARHAHPSIRNVLVAQY